MKEKILQVLKEKVGKTNLSEKTISDYVNGIASFVTDEAQLTEQFYAAHVGIIKSMDGNFNHDVAAQVDEAKKNLVTPQATPATPPVVSPDVQPTVPPVVNPNDAILAKLNEISERQNKIEQAEALKAKQVQRNQLLESIRKVATTKDAANEKSGWATNAGLLTNALALITIEDTDTEESISKKCQDKYNAMATEIFGKSDAVPGVGGGGNTEATDWSEEKKRLQERGSLPK